MRTLAADHEHRNVRQHLDDTETVTDMSVLTIEVLFGFKELDETRKQILLGALARLVQEQRAEDLAAIGASNLSGQVGRGR
jgi:hypothetical protein